MNTGHHPHPHHRHSAEILSPPIDSSSGSNNGTTSDLTFSPSQVNLFLKPKNFDLFRIKM